jgi:ubiquinone/menaquinone biosynthesis C-methylase UbiE
MLHITTEPTMQTVNIPFPDDGQELDRLNMMHQLLMDLLDGELFSAQMIREPGNILDLGCGTGIWAMDVAESFPELLS